MTVSDAVARRDGIANFMEPYKADFAAVLPSHIKPEQWLRLTAGVLRRNEALAKVARSNPGSLIAAMFKAARLGLEVDETFHLVPFGNEIIGITDYTGLIELAYRAGEVVSIKAEVVYSRDKFHYLPGDRRPTHEPDWFTDRGDMIGAYAYAELRSGATSRVVVRNRAEIEDVRKVSRAAMAKDSPWQRWPDRMYLKTVIRELMKFVPTSAEYRTEVIRATAAVADVTAKHGLPAPLADLPDLDGEVIGEAWPEVAPVPDAA